MLRLSVFLGFALFCPVGGFAAPCPQAARPPARQKPAVPAPPTQFKKWSGDLDGMLQRRVIRVVVAYSKTQYYVVSGVQRGISYEGGKAFEDYINKKYPPKNRSLRARVVFSPAPRDELFSRLAAGTADIAFAGLTITPERQKRKKARESMQNKPAS